MDPVFARNRLSAWMDGELSGEEAREVERALAEHPELREELDELRHVARLLRPGADERPSRGFAGRVLAAVDEEPEVPSWTSRMPRVRLDVLLLAAVVLLTVAVVARTRGEEADARGKVSANEAPAAPSPGAAADSEGAGGGGEPPQRPPDPTASTVVSGVPVAAASDLPLAATPAGAVDPWNGKPPGTAPHLGSPAGARKGSTGTPSRGGTRPPVVSMRDVPEIEPIVQDWEHGATALAVLTPGAEYRIDAARETTLKELAAVAAELGGRLVDARGRTLAPYPMDPGDTRAVQLLVPPDRVQELGVRLEALGSVTVSNLRETQATAVGSPVPVRIEIRQP
jgi:anti-sigma factor RsiW